MEKINTVDKPVARLHKEKRNRNQIINEWADIAAWANFLFEGTETSKISRGLTTA